MTLTVSKCQEHIAHTLGGDLSPSINSIALINEAGEFFASIHPWKWLENVEAKLDLRGKIDFTAGTSATTTVTKAGAFTNYTFLEGDQLEITSSSGITNGHYRIVSSTSDTLTLATSPGTTGTALAGTIHTSAVSLPSDFRELIAYNTTSGLLKGIQFTGFQDLVGKRAANFTTVGFHYAALVHPTDTSLTANGAPVPRLEIWPTPSADEIGSFTIIYRAGWTRVSSDQHKLRLPVWCEAIYLQVLRAFARGYEEEDEGTMSARLTDVLAGPLFESAISRDGGVQPNLGPIENGAATLSRYANPLANFTTISGPS